MPSTAEITVAAPLGVVHADELSQNMLVSVGLLAVAVGVWVLEIRRRSGAEEAGTHGATSNWNFPGLTFRGSDARLNRLVPEAAGLLLCIAYASVLLWLGGNRGAPLATSADQDIWQGINAEWPVLTTADSLLAFTAALRMLLLASAVLRVEDATDSPLAGEPAALLLFAAIARVTLLALSPQDVYHLDGPLGGIMHIVMEVAAVGPLAFLAVSKGFKTAASVIRGFVLTGAAAVFAGWLAFANHLALADPQEAYLDVLFSFAFLLELGASMAFLLRTLASAANGSLLGPFTDFAHLLLPVQQLLPTYFLLTAWGGNPLEEMPPLVGAGRPFLVLQLASAAQVGLYVFAAILHFNLGEGQKDEGFHILV